MKDNRKSTKRQPKQKSSVTGQNKYQDNNDPTEERSKQQRSEKLDEIKKI